MSFQTDRPSLPRRALGCLAAFVTMNVAGTLIAMAMGPFVGPHFGSLMRDPARDGLNFPSLLLGYAVVAVALASMLGSYGPKPPARSAQFGLTLGLAVFLGDHLITSGWSVMPAGAMALSGILDSLAVAIGAVAFSWVTVERTRSKNAHAH